MLEIPLKTDVVASIGSLLCLLLGWGVYQISQMVNLPLYLTCCRYYTCGKFLIHHHDTRLVCDDHIGWAGNLVGFHHSVLGSGIDFCGATSLLKFIGLRGLLFLEGAWGLDRWPCWGYTSGNYGAPGRQALLLLKQWIICADRSVLRICNIAMKPTAECIRVCLLPLSKLRTVICNLRDRDLWRHLEINPLGLLDAGQLHTGNRYGAEFRSNTSLILVLHLLLLHLGLIL